MDINHLKKLKELAAMKNLDLSNLSEEQKKEFEKMAQAARNVQGKSDQDAMQELMKMAQQGKATGQLNDEKLRQFSQSIAPMLDENQKKRLEMIMKMLKEDK